MKDVEGKVAFITGGASGIGYGMARTFLKNGMKVVIADYNQAYLDEKKSELEGSNAVHFIRMDVSDRADFKRAADEAERVFGKVHVLCNNAGVGGGGSADDPDFEDWDWMMSINLGGVVNGVKTFASRIKAHGEGGHIVNTSSMAGLTALPNEGGGYTTAKFAVRGLTESLRQTLAPHKIGVSLLCPGLTKSRLLSGADQTRPENRKQMEVERDLTSMFNTMEGAMDPLQLGEAVMKGIRSNAAYILPHGEFKDEIRELQQEILDSFPSYDDADPRRLAFEEQRRKRSEELRALAKKVG